MGPWRFGPDSGARDRVDLIYHSDALFSAVCSAMSQLGLARGMAGGDRRLRTSPAVRFSSFFPFVGDTLLVVPPRSLWPPPESTKIRYKGARFVPLPVIQALLSDQAIDEDRWTVDGESECLIPSGQPAAGRSASRCVPAPAWIGCSHAGWKSHSTACLEFARDAGLWTVVQFADGDAANNGKRRCAVRCCCWPIPVLAASARAVGAARKRRNGSLGRRRKRHAPEQPIGTRALAAVALHAGRE